MAAHSLCFERMHSEGNGKRQMRHDDFFEWDGVLRPCIQEGSDCSAMKNKEDSTCSAPLARTHDVLCIHKPSEQRMPKQRKTMVSHVHLRSL